MSETRTYLELINPHCEDSAIVLDPAAGVFRCICGEELLESDLEDAIDRAVVIAKAADHFKTLRKFLAALPAIPCEDEE